MDLDAGELRKSGVKIKLQEQPFRPLAGLLERPSDVVTREELRQKLWPADTFVDLDRSLNTAASKLREALGDSAEPPRFVETLPRRGYRFLAPVEVAGGEAAPVKTGMHRVVSRLVLESSSTTILGQGYCLEAHNRYIINLYNTTESLHAVGSSDVGCVIPEGGHNV